MPAEIPSDLRAKLDAFIAKDPSARELVDKLLKKHAEGSERQAADAEKMLRYLVKPDRGRAVGWIFGIMFLIGGAWLAYDIRAERAYETALANSTPAVALVKRMDPGDCTTTPKQARCLRLELEIHIKGVAPYTASITHNIDIEWMSRVQPGSWLTVGVNPDDPNEILFNKQAMAVAAPAPPSE